MVEAGDLIGRLGVAAPVTDLAYLAEEQPSLAKRRSPQSDRQGLVQRRDEVELELVAHLLRQVLEVRLVVLRQDDRA